MLTTQEFTPLPVEIGVKCFKFDKKLAEIHDANNKFLQLNTAMKNINLIVNIKEKVAKAEKHLNEENFLLVSYIIKKNILFS